MDRTEQSPPRAGNEEGQEGSLTDCLLSQYRLCAAGIGLGTAYSLKFKKGLVPMIAAGAVGTTADMVYGYLVECAHLTKSAENNDNPTTKIGTGTNFKDASPTKEINGNESGQ
ncbi:unnamed protein product [Pseudo-nitzschia multistriata]|uniref:Uncharacterized protein n=1 Tax=Pseudo-nitzschia multistriata TaxID=183589 RepID=A0A448Z5K1_9STRA|nr:unnamed protein product [Pseudo-nitzschia multistriata]VEU42666.1 unnamed protein product [Pseudo-nitzschia multistriata]